MTSTLKSIAGWVTLGPNLDVFPLEQTRRVGVVKSEHPTLTNGEIIFEEFQPMSVSYTHLRAHETGRNLVCRLLLEKKK